MKIKTKKQMNLPRLIEWGFNNDVTNQYFRANDARGNISEVYFNVTGLPQFSSMVDKQDTFTVEVEEEITEDTVFSELVGLRADDSYWKYENTCINDFNLEVINAIYIPNDDLTMTLIWKDGKLVE